jgi:hypothetical protein
MTPAPSTEAHGVARWISSLEARPASPSAWPDGGGDTRMIDGSGPPLLTSLSSVDPPWCSSRTQLELFASDSTASSKTYQQWVTTLRRESLRRRKSARHTSGKESSSSATGMVASAWPTPQAHDAHGGKTPEQVAEMRQRTGAGVSNLNETAEMWRSPTVGSAKKGSGEHPDKRRAGGHAIDLQDQAEFWQTPAASEAGFSSRGGARKGELLLGGQAREWAWPTPTAKAGEDSQTHRSGKRSGELLLTGAAQQFSHPSHPPATIGTDGAPSSPDGPNLRPRYRLNPAFVSWLMGWGPNWTSLNSPERNNYESWGTAWSQFRQHTPCGCSAMTSVSSGSWAAD